MCSDTMLDGRPTRSSPERPTCCAHDGRGVKPEDFEEGP